MNPLRAVLPLVVCALVLLWGADAHAQNSADRFDGTDMALAGTGGTLIGLGFGLGAAALAGRTAPSDGFSELGRFLLVLPPATAVGTTFGVWGLSEAMGGDGSLAWTTLGTCTGILASVGTVVAIDPEVGLFSLAVLPGLGASVAYWLTRTTPQINKQSTQAFSLFPTVVPTADGGFDGHLMFHGAF